MAHDPWIPMQLGLVATTLGFLVVLALPETLNRKKPDGGSPPEALDGADFAEMSQSRFVQPKPYLGPSGCVSLWNRATTFLSTFIHESHFLIEDWRILLVMSAVAASLFADASSSFHLPYVSKRYAWPISQAAYLTSFRAGISAITLLTALPAASAWLQRRHGYTAFGADIFLARGSFTLATTGLLLMGLARSTTPFLIGCFIATLSAGVDALLQSLLSSLVPPTAIARLFTVTSIVQTISTLAAAPILAGLYRWGLQQAGEEEEAAWMGAPFIFCGLIYSAATAAMWLLEIHIPASLLGE